MSLPAIKQRLMFNYSESLEKSQKSGSSLHTASSVKTHYLMTDALQGSFVSSLVPLPLVPCLLLTLLPLSPRPSLSASLWILVISQPLFFLKTSLLKKGNLFINCMKAFHCESISLNL